MSTVKGTCPWVGDQAQTGQVAQAVDTDHDQPSGQPIGDDPAEQGEQQGRCHGDGEHEVADRADALPCPQQPDERCPSGEAASKPRSRSAVSTTAPLCPAPPRRRRS